MRPPDDRAVCGPGKGLDLDRRQAHGGNREEMAMPTQKLCYFLDSQKIAYEIIQHSPAFTTQEVAAITHIRGKELAKTVILKLNGTLAMFVLPAGLRVDLDHL